MCFFSGTPPPKCGLPFGLPVKATKEGTLKKRHTQLAKTSDPLFFMTTGHGLGTTRPWCP